MNKKVKSPGKTNRPNKRAIRLSAKQSQLVVDSMMRIKQQYVEVHPCYQHIDGRLTGTIRIEGEKYHVTHIPTRAYWEFDSRIKVAK